MNWTTLLLDQLTFHWDHQVRPGLADLTDDEYYREPVPGMGSVRGPRLAAPWPPGVATWWPTSSSRNRRRCH
ncbi:MAG: hypothetical protein R2713_10545 [Ilumatobacteraceae bacterium]